MGDHQQLMEIDGQSAVGGLLRGCWLPFLPIEALREREVLPVRLLGESLVCYRDEAGTIGLIGEFCGHQFVSLKWGYPADHGLRCAYHDWCYDETGKCTDMSVDYGDEEERIAGYPVAQLGPLLFAYLGDGPPPPLPALPESDATLVALEYSVLPRHWLHVIAEDYPTAKWGSVGMLTPPSIERPDEGGTVLVELTPVDSSHTLRIERRYSSDGQPVEAVVRYLPGDEAETDYWNTVDIAGATARAFLSEAPDCGCAPGSEAASLHEWAATVVAAEVPLSS